MKGQNRIHAGAKSDNFTTIAPTRSGSSVKLLSGLAATRNVKLSQFDIQQSCSPLREKNST